MPGPHPPLMSSGPLPLPFLKAPSPTLHSSCSWQETCSSKSRARHVTPFPFPSFPGLSFFCFHFLKTHYCPFLVKAFQVLLRKKQATEITPSLRSVGTQIKHKFQSSHHVAKWRVGHGLWAKAVCESGIPQCYGLGTGHMISVGLSVLLCRVGLVIPESEGFFTP